MNRDDRSAFALRLRTLRKQAKMTQADVAQALNLHRTAYTKYETDKASPDYTCLLAIADLFHVTADYLLGNESESHGDTLNDDESDTFALSPEERELIASFRRLTGTQQQLLLQTERELLSICLTEKNRPRT